MGKMAISLTVPEARYRLAETRALEDLLKRALRLAKSANAPRAADKIRLAIKSAGGAVRHAERRLTEAMMDERTAQS